MKMTVHISKLRVRDRDQRIRKELGDLSDLLESWELIGQIHGSCLVLSLSVCPTTSGTGRFTTQCGLLFDLSSV